MNVAVKDFAPLQLDVQTTERAIAALLEQAAHLHASDLFLASRLRDCVNRPGARE